jgi:phospholipid/cholesterol/gamma-HCH transport system substrate-binding protein
MISFRERRAWLVGAISLVLIGVGLGFAFNINKFEDFRGVYSLAADLEDAAGLQPGNEVRVAGVKVGQVKNVELRPRAARVHMEVETDIDLPVETRLEVKLKTLLGQKFIDLQMPEAFITGGSAGGTPTNVTDGMFKDGDVIPIGQTSVPFEIYQAATEGTRTLEGIDKEALRDMLDVLGGTIGESKEELSHALVAIDRAGKVLRPKSAGISRLLRNLQKVTGTLAASDEDIGGILDEGGEVLETLARRRRTLSSLLAATNDLSANLGLLVEVSRGHVQNGVADLDSILITAEGELRTIEKALDELGIAQGMFAAPLRHGRFVEGHACAVTSEDTCVPDGSPEKPGLPSRGTQPTTLRRVTS